MNCFWTNIRKRSAKARAMGYPWTSGCVTPRRKAWGNSCITSPNGPSGCSSTSSRGRWTSYIANAAKGGDDPANPAWHIGGGRIPNDAGSPIPFTMLLNLASVVNADTPDMLWGFIARYHPGAGPDTTPFLARLVDHAVAYYRDFVRTQKHFRPPRQSRRRRWRTWRPRLPPCPPAARPRRSRTRCTPSASATRSRRSRTGSSACTRCCWASRKGPRFGGFVALYGIPETVALIRASLVRQADAA